MFLWGSFSVRSLTCCCVYLVRFLALCFLFGKGALPGMSYTW